MPEDVRTCILCGSDRNAPFDHRTFRGREVTNRICLTCGLVYQSPRMTESESASFYANEYRLFQEGSASPTVRNIYVQEGRAVELYDFTRATIPSISRHLDIGCSAGILLQYFQSEYHNQAVGVEPSDAHRMAASKEGLTVYATLEALEKCRESCFDLISISHVLEHLPDPVGYLTHLRDSTMAPGGWLMIEVPNLYAHDSFEVAHLYAFSPHSLHEVLRKSGFEVVKFKKHGRPNSAILPLFLTVLCHPAQTPDIRPIQPERGVALKRCIGMFRRRILAGLFPKRAWLVQG